MDYRAHGSSDRTLLLHTALQARRPKEGVYSITIGSTYRAHVGRAHTRPPSAWRRRRGRQAGHTLHTRHASESCRRTATPSEEATDRNAQQSAVVWYGLVAVWTALRDSAHTHRYSPRCTLESRLLASDSFDVDFASVKSVSLWQFLRLGHLCQRSYYSRLSIAAPCLPHYRPAQ